MKEITTERFKFMSHRECEFFPCHEGADPENFNCLFCYCPLYALGDKCGGNFFYHEENGVKDCSNCLIPHTRKAFEYINAHFKDIKELAKKSE
ncbi:MAG: cysteine-rich small domain-containing protein [Eubacteriaceae bacterium]|nr:cysteine-rich small domain-containing protein [Eubacteriaceae bacterium]